MPWLKPSDGVYWSDFCCYRSKPLNLISTGFGTDKRVRQADVVLRTIEEDIKDTSLALDQDFKKCNNSNSRTA
jgi:hypothetical protein